MLEECEHGVPHASMAADDECATTGAVHVPDGSAGEPGKARISESRRQARQGRN
jgi:hypothetical protein